MTIPPDPPESREPFGFSIFCEDIRHEVGGLTTYVGVLGPALGFPAYPLILPKFAVAVTYRQPADLPRDEPLGLKLLFDHDDPALGRAVVAEGDIDLGGEIQPQTGPETMWAIAGAMIQISPLQLAGPGVMRVRVYPKGRPPIRMGALSFKLGAAPAAITTAASFQPGKNIPQPGGG